MISIYLGFSFCRVSIYLVFSFCRISIYLGFSFYRVSVYLGFSFCRISIYLGFSLCRVSVYLGFSFNRFDCIFIFWLFQTHKCKNTQVSLLWVIHENFHPHNRSCFLHVPSYYTDTCSDNLDLNLDLYHYRCQQILRYHIMTWNMMIMYM